MTHPVVVAARGWIGTPYVHQASLRGAGTDCLGLIRGVWRDLVGPEPETPPPYTADWSEPSGDEILWRRAMCHLLPAASDDPAPGQVLLFRMRDGGPAKHMGIVGAPAPQLTLIHAYSGHGVVESPLDRPWLRRVIARFEFPL